MLLLAGCRGGGLLGRELASQAKDMKFGGGSGEHKDKKVPPVFDTAPFDFSRAALPPHYDGHDITKVYASFESPGRTTPDGRKRPSKRPADRQVQSGTAGIYAFRESIGQGPPGNDLLYDEEHGSFKVRIRVEPCFDGEGNVRQDRLAFVLVGYPNKQGPAQVQRPTRWLLWEVSAADGPAFRERVEVDRAGAYLTAEGRVPRNEAPMGRDIAALLVCAPRAAAQGLSVGPGLSPTIEGSGFGHYYLICDFLELWVYDYATGRVFVKAKII